MKNISILGSTGSIGTQTLDIIRKNKDKFNIIGLSCNKNIELLKKIYRKLMLRVAKNYKEVNC